VKAGREFFSVPFFYNPRFDSVVRPIAFPAHILPPLTGEPLVDPADPVFAEYGYNALKGRLRSHRDVAERFYIAGVEPSIYANRRAPQSARPRRLSGSRDVRTDVSERTSSHEYSSLATVATKAARARRNRTRVRFARVHSFPAGERSGERT
jgi:hypothetical protein